ncbi:MAG: zonular occludens toxin domain-containing protein [Corallococcus sp.]|nr:zonular occludens toxin domain-containing protein [Corallococcus sp.]
MITIVFGKPGCGKTAFLTANAAQYLNGSAMDGELYDGCCEEVSKLNAEGFRFELPKHSPVYSNYPITVQNGANSYVGSYYVDGFHLGFENSDVEVFCVLPGSKIFLAEAQRYYNSRKSKDLPDWVSRFYEEHRHFGLDIMLDVQRPGLIDVNIRELAERFVEIEQIVQRRDKNGYVSGTEFYCKVFEDWKFVDRYLNGSADNFEKRIYSFDFDVFEYYQSTSYYRNFLPSDGFDYIEHFALENVEKDVERAKLMYRQTPPTGFYPEGKGGRKCN